MTEKELMTMAMTPKSSSLLSINENDDDDRGPSRSPSSSRNPRQAEDKSEDAQTKSSSSSSNTTTKNNGNMGTRTSSSFFLLNKQSDKTISQIKVSLEDVTYRPITASTSAATGRQRQRRRRHQRNNNNNNNSTNTNTNTHEEEEQEQQHQHQHRTIVLDKITTEINPFELTAWMGPSGSGKTSLTSVVAGLVDDPDNDITSDSIIKVNNERGTIPKQMVGVVWQDDLLLSNLTVEETIYFAARLKTPTRTVTDGTVKTLVEETMKELGLLHLRNNLIGSLSGGERKRTAVAVELVVRPSLLVCDEPTSGLDATTAHSLMKTLKDLTSLGHSIAVVIHQPRTDIFNMFDRLLLLSKGRVVYDGKTCRVRSYLESTAAITSTSTSTSTSHHHSVVKALPPETGIADWIMDTIIADEQQQQQQQQQQKKIQMYNQNQSQNEESGCGTTNNEFLSLPDHWAKQSKIIKDDTDNKNKTIDSISDDRDRDQRSHSSTTTTTNTNSRRFSSLTELRKSSRNNMCYEASFRKELSMLTKRITKQQRGEKLTKVSLLLTLTYLVFTSFMYWRLPNDTANIFERNSLIFFMLIAQGNGIVTSSISVFNRERALLRRERAKKMYRVLPFFLAKAASDMTNNIALPMAYGAISYWTAGLRPSFGRFLKFLVGYYLSLSCAQSMGFFLSILYPNMVIAMILAPPITLFMFILGGFYIPISNMHVAMKWISCFSFARYGYSALLINEYEGRDIPCSSSSDNDNDNDDGDDDGEFSSAGITIGGGIDQCPLPGDAVYESIGINGVFANYWFNIGILVIFQTLFLIGAYVLLRRSK